MPTNNEPNQDQNQDHKEMLFAFYNIYGSPFSVEDRALWLIALGAFTLGWNAHKEKQDAN